MAFRVGQKVVCVDNEPQEGKSWALCPRPTLETVYTISVATFRDADGDEVVQIAEIYNPVGMLASRFRPVVERETDISIFTAMLNTSKTGVEA